MNDGIIINFGKYPFSFEQINDKKFINKFTNVDDCKEKMNILFKKIIPCINMCKSFEEAQKNYKHCHVIDNEHLEQVYYIVKKMCVIGREDLNSNLFVEQNLVSEKIWQIGFEEIRVIGIRRENILDVLFIDFNHQLYPSTKKNQKDLSQNNFSVLK